MKLYGIHIALSMNNWNRAKYPQTCFLWWLLQERGVTLSPWLTWHHTFISRSRLLLLWIKPCLLPPSKKKVLKSWAPVSVDVTLLGPRDLSDDFVNVRSLVWALGQMSLIKMGNVVPLSLSFSHTLYPLMPLQSTGFLRLFDFDKCRRGLLCFSPLPPEEGPPVWPASCPCPLHEIASLCALRNSSHVTRSLFFSITNESRTVS